MALNATLKYSWLVCVSHFYAHIGEQIIHSVHLSTDKLDRQLSVMKSKLEAY